MSNLNDAHEVPVSTGSPRFVTVEVGGFEFTDAWFPPGTRLATHTHDRTVVAVTLEGRIESALARHTLSCQQNDVWTEPGGDAHANTVGDEGARVLVLQPDPALDELLHPARALLDDVRWFSSPAVAALARRVVPELRSKDPLSSLQLEGLALEMLASATRVHDEPRRALPAGFSRAMARLHDEFRTGTSIAALAEEAGLHASYFAKVFRRYTGRTVGEYVRELRTEWACERIKESDVPLGRIALEAGFADQSHFTRTFKRLRGITPRQFRLRN